MGDFGCKLLRKLLKEGRVLQADIITKLMSSALKQHFAFCGRFSLHFSMRLNFPHKTITNNQTKTFTHLFTCNER